LARVSGQAPVAPADVGLEGQDDEADVGLIEEDATSEELEAHERLDRLYRDDTIIEEKRRALRPQKPIPDMPRERSDQPRPPEALEAARLYERGDIRGAAEQLEVLIERCYPHGGADCPDEAKVRSDLGAQYHQSDRWEEAVVQLERAVELEPTNGVALNNLAVTLNTLGRADEADDVYERALRAVKARMAPSLFRVESYVWDRLPDARVPF
jgi:tetratricopeptide (TPR) repeat protein